MGLVNITIINSFVIIVNKTELQLGYVEVLVIIIIVITINTSMLLISTSIDLRRTCIPSLCSIDKLSFPSISILSFLL